VISTLITLLIIVVICALVYWIFSLLPLPAPFRQIANVIIVVLFALILIFYVLLPLAGRAHTLR